MRVLCILELAEREGEMSDLHGHDNSGLVRSAFKAPFSFSTKRLAHVRYRGRVGR